MLVLNFERIKMLLSILIPGKNDNFRANTKKVLEFNINKTIANISELGSNDIELVLCDWGSDNKIIDSLNIKKSKYLKYIYVPQNITKKYNGKGSYSIVHPINTAFRKSCGKYVIFWDSDCYVATSEFYKLYEFIKKMHSTNDMNFYWGSRYNIPFSIYMNLICYQELDSFLNQNIIYNHNKISIHNFRGNSISLLMNRELWENSTGFYEKLIYWGWQDIEFHHRLLHRYTFGGDLENNNIYFYHLIEKLDNKVSDKIINPWHNAPTFRANDSTWGLYNEQLEIITY